jgi:L-ornithine N5-oxygenase
MSHEWHDEVELLAIGAGPSNLALAVALDETAPADLAEHSLVIERDEDISWQRGMLLPEALSQVSFLKDLVTLRDPRSRFSFVNYLHSVGRLDDFVNMGSFVPFRVELAGYFRWAAQSLQRVRLRTGQDCRTVAPVRSADGTLTGWLTTMADGSTIGSRYLVIGAGRDPHVPEVFAGLPTDRIVHSTRYRQRITELRDRLPGKDCRVTVIGGAQSAAEMFGAVQQDLPGCRPTMVMRSIGLNAYESSKFTNELFYPSFTDEFHAARPEAREQLLSEMHRTNYAGLAPHTLDGLYRQLYLDRMSGEGRLTLLTMTDVTGARTDGADIVLELTDRRTGQTTEQRTDLVLLGTGFAKQMPGMVRGLAASLGLDRVEVDRNYRLVVDGPATAACYLQGVNEATHGIADSLLSVLAVRAGDIAGDLFAHRAGSAVSAVAAVEQPGVVPVAVEPGAEATPGVTLPAAPLATAS